MKKTKIFGLTALGLVGLGGLASIPLGITSCNKKKGDDGNLASDYYAIDTTNKNIVYNLAENKITLKNFKLDDMKLPEDAVIETEPFVPIGKWLKFASWKNEGAVGCYYGDSLQTPTRATNGAYYVTGENAMVGRDGEPSGHDAGICLAFTSATTLSNIPKEIAIEINVEKTGDRTTIYEQKTYTIVFDNLK